MTTPPSAERSVARDFAFWWLALSAIAGSMSLISLAQRLFAVGLTPVLARFLEFYRSLLYPIFDVVQLVLPFSIPQWYRDLYLLSLLLLTNVARAQQWTYEANLKVRAISALSGHKPSRFRQWWETVHTWGLFIFIMLIVSIFLAGFWFIYTFWTRPSDYGQAADRRFRLRFVGLMGCMIAASVAFFALNAQF